MSKRHKIQVIVDCIHGESAQVDKMTTSTGDKVSVVGEVHSILVSKDGKLQWNISIAEDGAVSFTDHAGMGFRVGVPSMTMIPMSPWKT